MSQTQHQPIASLDFLRELKEMQLQHGLRSDDFARYHKYLSRRLHTLRSQLNMGNGKKQFLNKHVTVQNATDAKHIMMVALEAERAWATAEEIRAQLADEADGTSAAAENGGATKCSLQHHERNRMNKAAGWATKLKAIVEAVGTKQLCLAVSGYVDEMHGRRALSHGDYAGAKTSFKAARDSYYGLHPHCNQTQWSLVVAKVRECDDRVVYAMQRIGEAIHSYNPDTDKFGDSGEDAAKVTWLGRQLTVYSVKVKELLRAAVETDQQRAAFQKSRDCVGTLNAQPRLLEFFDRSIGHYNDAISHSQQDIRDNVGDRTQLQLLEHFLRYQLHHITLQRTLFMVDIYARRFRLTAAAVEKGSSLPPVPIHSAILSQVGSDGEKSSGLTTSNAAASSGWNLGMAASPIEIVHLYEQAIEAANKMSVLPGVDDDDTLSDEVNDSLALTRAGRMHYIAEGWGIAGSRTKAFAAFMHVEKILKGISKQSESQRRAKILLAGARTAVTRLAAAQCLDTAADAEATTSVANASQLSESAAAAAVLKAQKVLAEVPKGSTEFKPYKSFVRLPPDYQSVPCKPAFVDIASTFVDMPGSGADVPAAEEGGAAAAPSSKPHRTEPQQQKKPSKGNQQQEGEGGADGKKAGWFSGWGWGGKK